MKKQEQIEKALSKYQQLLKENIDKRDYEDDWLEVFYKSKDIQDLTDHWKDPNWQEKKNKLLICQIETLVKYFEADRAAFACEKLIKNCKWILDIE